MKRFRCYVDMASTLGFLTAIGSTQANFLNSDYSVPDRARSIDEGQLEPLGRHRSCRVLHSHSRWPAR
jgi:hypothetical protein